MKLIKFILSILCLLPSAFIAWFFWGFARGWCFSQIPQGVQWAGLAKIAVVVLIGWGGGLVLPFIAFIVGCVMVSEIIKD